MSGNTLAGGGVTIVGGAVYTAPSYQYIGSGSIEVSGGAEVSSISDMGVIETVSDAVVSMTVTVDFGTTEGEPLVPDDTPIFVNCDCGQLSPTVNFYTNLVRGDNPLQIFMERNAITFPNTLQLIYNNRIFSWEENLAYAGYGTKGDDREIWNFNVQWSCTNQIGASTFGESVFWKFLLNISQQSTNTEANKITKVLIALGPGGECSNVGFVLDTQTGVVTTDKTVDSVKVVDEIGMFSTGIWKEDPNLNLRVTQLVVRDRLGRLDITPLFPDEQPVLVSESEPGVYIA